MNEQYAVNNEIRDFELFKEFSPKLKLKDLGRLEDKKEFDASGYTQDNRYVEIELKNRDITVNQYPSIMIEPYKFAYARENKDRIPLYVNFTRDGYVILFNLHKVGKLNERNFNIPSKLYERVKESKRYEIPIQKAWIYEKVGNKYKLVKVGA